MTNPITEVKEFVEGKIAEVEKRAQAKLLRLLARVANLVADMLAKAASDLENGIKPLIGGQDKPGIPPDTGG